MHEGSSPTTLERRTAIGLYSALGAGLLFFFLSGLVTYQNTRTLHDDAQLVTHTQEVLETLGSLLSLTQDAETGQRGFVLTGDVKYLEPYTKAVPQIVDRLSTLRELTSDNPVQVERIPELKARLDLKLAELAETVELRKTSGFDAAKDVVLSDRGKNAMDAVRSQLNLFVQEERDLRIRRHEEMQTAYDVAQLSGVLTGSAGILLSIAVAYLLRRASLARQREEWLQRGQIGLGQAIAGDLRLEQVGDKVLGYLSRFLDAHAGAFFVRDQGRLLRAASYGAPLSGGIPATIDFGDGLVGQAVKDRKSYLIHDVPDGYLTIGSALGQGKPRHLLIMPMVVEGEVNGVVELGFIHPVEEEVTELFDKISEPIGTAIRSVHYRSNLQNLLEETQRQSEELQVQSEELRVSNEELEEQGKVLRESQSRLEQQQRELEQTNSQLEEQTQLLEYERDEANQARASVQRQARELEQANRYKSDFLANMSHELRTPLNSSLILAKLLAENRDGNLTREQVEFAETIQSSGNDLLALINDILDLSKIEAGYMEVHPEPMLIGRLVEDLTRTFLPIAAHKDLQFSSRVSPEAPTSIETDRQRLEQVLRNLLSNAIKFTELGSVEIAVVPAANGRIAFEVRDTGIGIPDSHQQLIFDAFKQADGTINRRFGGTGLGLSISRELVRLLGGEIRVASQAGAGSLFTVEIPEKFTASRSVRSSQRSGGELRTEDSPITSPPSNPGKTESREAPTVTSLVDDDRSRLSGQRGVILVIEDDDAFARILYELAHELNFDCLIAGTADEGLAMAQQYLPAAVVLDVRLPDHTGLSVLDRLKHDNRTRHIAVHVVSADDYSQTAMSLGAAGHFLKPIKRDELAQALREIETRLTNGVRRILVVEDDPVQLESLRRLLQTLDVDVVGTASAAECLEALRESTFDCMIVDLTLPDASGYALLETLSQEDAYSFPPAIVYTGRDLSADEEQKLRRYSRSIIIKGAKSPERLLDEVTLFLHRVVAELPADQQRMLEQARSRDAVLEGRRILVVEDDVRNVFALTSILEPRGAIVQIARNGREALQALNASSDDPSSKIDLLLMDVMMPEMDGITATRELRKDVRWKRLPVIMLTAKAMKNDQETCLAAGANDYLAKPLDVEKLLSLVRVWMPR